MKLIKKFSDLLFLVFCTVLLSGICVTQTNFKINTELPLSDFNGFVVDSHENVYIGDSFYSVIQKFDREGKFIQSIKVNNYGKSFRIGIDKMDKIIVKSNITRSFTIYSHDNYNKKFVVYDRKYDETKNPNKFFFTQKAKFENLGTFYPSIWKLSGKKQKIIEQNFILKLLSLPTMVIIIPFFLFLKFLPFISKKIMIVRNLSSLKNL